MRQHYENPEVGAKLQRIIDSVIRAVPTKEIILFGSYAYGEPHQGSDIDIMVVTSILNTNTPDWYSRIESSFMFDSDFDVDLVVYPQGLLENRAQSYSFEYKVLRDGVRIYRSEEHYLKSVPYLDGSEGESARLDGFRCR